MAFDRIAYDRLEEQTKEKFGCGEHEVVKVRNALGYFVCPVCVVEECNGDS